MTLELDDLSTIRRGTGVAIVVDLAMAIDCGLPIRRTTGSVVISTETVPAFCLKRAFATATGDVIWHNAVSDREALARRYKRFGPVGPPPTAAAASWHGTSSGGNWGWRSEEWYHPQTSAWDEWESDSWYGRGWGSESSHWQSSDWSGGGWGQPERMSTWERAMVSDQGLLWSSQREPEICPNCGGSSKYGLTRARAAGQRSAALPLWRATLQRWHRRWRAWQKKPSHGLALKWCP